MGAQKREIFDLNTNRNAELGIMVSASARIKILEFIDRNFMINIPVLEDIIPLHSKTLNHHVTLIERTGLIRGKYIGNVYYWYKNEEMEHDWKKIRWTYTQE